MPTDLLDTTAIVTAMALIGPRPAPADVVGGAGTVAATGAVEAIDAIDLLVMLDGAMNRLAGFRAEVVEIARQATLSRPPEDAPGRGVAEALDDLVAQRSFQAEIACALRISERAAETLIGHSRILTSQLPATLKALSEGEISYRHAQIMVDQSATFTGDSLTAFEATGLAKARTMSPTRFRDVARKLRERMAPESIRVRHELAVEDRQVILDPDRDGMAWLSARLPAPTAQAIYDRLTKGALALAKGAKDRGDTRTLTQRRADLFTRALLADTPASTTGSVVDDRGDDTEAFTQWFRGIRPEVFVTVPMLTLLGMSEEPAELDGYGPIDPLTARILTSNTRSLTRLLTHPETGAVLSVGRKRYKVPKDLKTWLRVRDGTCRFPGCGMPARRSQLDHNREWHDGGTTDGINLANFCQGHHTLKTLGLWTVKQHPNGTGVLTWTSPTGRKYTTHPEVELNAAS